MDIRLDKETGDAIFINKPLTLSDRETLNKAVVRDMPDTVAQRLAIRLRTFLSEWFMDTEYGTPYFQEILGKKNLRKSYIDSIMRSEIMKESGVKEIGDFYSDLSPSRVYSLNFKVRCVDGSVSDVIRIDTPF